MKARIVDIENNDVTIKTEGRKFIAVPRKSIKFNPEINQIVSIEKDGDKTYILPSGPSFFDDEVNDKPKKSRVDGKKMTIIVLSIICVVAPTALFFWAKDFFYQRGWDSAVVEKEDDYGRGWRIGFDGGKKEGLNQGYKEGYETGFSHAKDCAIRIVYGENITFDDCWDSLRK